MNLTLKELAGERSWDGKYGAMHAFRLLFEDGTAGEVVTKGDTADKRRAELQALIGKPGEYVLEDQGNFPDGNPKPKKVTDYPGKPQGQAGGGRAPQLSIEDRLRLDAFREIGLDRRTALMQAVAFHTGGDVFSEAVMATANKYLGWLRHARDSEPTFTASGATGSDTGSAGATPPASADPPSSGALSEAHRERAVKGPASSPPDKGESPLVQSTGGAPEPTSEGEGLRVAGEDTQGLSPSDLLRRAVELYGTKARVLSAARMYHEYRKVEDIHVDDLMTLIERHQAVSV